MNTNTEYEFPNIKATKNIAIKWDVETPLDYVMGEIDNDEDCNPMKDLIDILLPAIDEVAKAINATCYTKSNEISDFNINNDDKIAIFACMSASLHETVNEVMRYYKSSVTAYGQLLNNHEDEFMALLEIDNDDTCECCDSQLDTDVVEENKEDCETCEFKDTCEIKDSMSFFVNLLKRS